MKTVITLLALTLSAPLAVARDLGPDEALRLRDAGSVMAFDKLNEKALGAHPGATIEGTELEEQYGRYRYEVDLRDRQGVEWTVELDATNGNVLNNRQDD